jgi:hypothetical protein
VIAAKDKEDQFKTALAILSFVTLVLFVGCLGFVINRQDDIHRFLRLKIPDFDESTLEELLEQER